MRFKIPSRFDLGPHIIKTKHVDKCTGCDENIVGLAIYQKNLIELKTGTYDKNYQDFVYFHEVFHHILEHTGYSKLNADESFVDRVSASWLQFVKTME